jgi:hypothetical protein
MPRNISKDFQKLLRTATSFIDKGYFQSQVIGKNSRIKMVYRERVYCYELYHQMRNIWVQDGGAILHAEYDKIGSQFLANKNVKGVKPDFLIHTPGEIDKNFIAMEVKVVTARSDEIKCDLEKLSNLRYDANYRVTIFLIFGKNAKQKAEDTLILRGQWGIDLNTEIWAHENANEEATRCDEV